MPQIMSCRKVAQVSEELLRVVRSLLIRMLQRLKMWCGQGSEGAPEWTEFMMVVVSWGVSWSQVVSRLSGLALVSV